MVISPRRCRPNRLTLAGLVAIGAWCHWVFGTAEPSTERDVVSTVSATPVATVVQAGGHR